LAEVRTQPVTSRQLQNASAVLHRLNMILNAICAPHRVDWSLICGSARDMAIAQSIWAFRLASIVAWVTTADLEL